MFEWFSKGFTACVKAITKHSGKIACGFLIVAGIALTAAITLPTIMVGAAVVAGVSGVISAASGGYYIGRQDTLAEIQEQAVIREQDASKAKILIRNIKATSDLDATKTNEAAENAASNVVPALEKTVAQQGITLTNLATRVDDADSKQASDQIDFQRQIDALNGQQNRDRTRIDHLESLLANSVFQNNSGIHQRRRPAANDATHDERQRNNHDSQM